MKFGRVGPPALRKGGGDMPERSISGRIDRRFDASFNPLSSKPGKLETNIIPDMILSPLAKQGIQTYIL